MTEKLYDQFPYKTEFDATVISFAPSSEGMDSSDLFDLILDKTCFFPEQGGQTGDRGYIGDAFVENTVIEDGIIIHKVRMVESAEANSEKVFKSFFAGESVSARIDWSHRYANMQQHTGEHIFTGLAHNLYGCENVGFHLSDNVVTLDLDKLLNDDQIENLEREANIVIERNVPINCFYPPQSELSGYDYRSKSGIEGDVRLVEIEGVDLCACCAPHVKSTGEVCFLKVIDFEKYKGGVRISILCGRRALKEWCTDKQNINRAVKTTGCNIIELPELFLKLRDENALLRRKIAELKQEKILTTINPNTEKFCVIFETGLDIKCMREVVNGYVEGKNRGIAICSGDDELGYDFVAGSSVEGFDVKTIIEALKSKLDVKGGGTGRQIQGHINGSRTEIEEIMGDSKWQD